MIDLNRYHNIDCMEFMSGVPDGFFDLCIIDPPYGIGISENINKIPRKNKYKIKKWDKKIPEQKYFDELFRISKNQIIWGGNFFINRINKNSPCWIVWDKNNGKSNFADCELAWTSFKSPIRKIKKTWCGSSAKHETKTDRIHPTQKPIFLYRWLLQNYAKPGDKIFDSHVGSASSLIACIEEGFDYVGCELDPDYYRDSVVRIETHKQQGKLF